MNALHGVGVDQTANVTLPAFALLAGALVLLYVWIEQVPPGSDYGRRHIVSAAALLLIWTASLLVAGALIRATALTLGLVTLIGLASRTKKAHLGLRLAAPDLRIFVGGGARFLAERHTRLAFFSFVVLAAAVSGFGLVVAFLPDLDVPLLARLAIFAGACSCFAFPDMRPATNWLRVATGRYGHVSGFVASAIAAIGHRHGWRLAGVGARAACLPKVVQKAGPRPHMIFIQHESTFDPGVYGLASTKEIEAFLRPPGALAGRLTVDVMGGSSWETEFTLQTGISSLCFGRDHATVFYRGVGRVRHSLVSVLAKLGYRSTVFHGYPVGFCNYDVFYRSLGAEVISGTDLWPGDRREQNDRLLYRALLARLDGAFAAGPQCLFVLTDLNHEPHHMTPPGLSLSTLPRLFALADSGSAPYAEYFARLDLAARAYGEFRDALRARYPGEAFVIVRYGDHQPPFVLQELSSRASDPAAALMETFYAIEGVNCALHLSARPACDPLHVAFLGTVALKAAGLPLDPVRTLHADLIEECGSAYFKAPSPRRERFHRLLIDMGLIRAEAAR